MTDPRKNKGAGWEDRDRRYDYDARSNIEEPEERMKRTYYKAKDKAADMVSDEPEDMMDKVKRTYYKAKDKVADKVSDVSDYFSGDRDARRRLGRDAEKATGGWVSREDLPDMSKRKEKASTLEGNRLLEGDKPIDIVCVDGSRGADKAIKYAFKNLPKGHSFLLVHGIYSPITGRSSRDDDWESMKIEKKYRGICREAGRECAFMHFNFTSNNDFGDRVCRFARYNNVKSVVLGRREDVSDIRRTFLGSSSQAVLNHCTTPVTMVSDEGKESYID